MTGRQTVRRPSPASPACASSARNSAAWAAPATRVWRRPAVRLGFDPGHIRSTSPPQLPHRMLAAAAGVWEGRGAAGAQVAPPVQWGRPRHVVRKRVWLQVHGAPPPAQTNLPRGLGQRALSIVVRALAGRDVADPHHAGMVSGHPAARCGLRPRHLVAAIAGYAPAAGALGGNAGHAGRSGRDTDIAPRPARVACGPVPTTDPHGGTLSAPTPRA